MQMSTAPRNTASPSGYMEVASKGFPGSKELGNAILEQESDGQKSLINSDTLPSQMSPDDRKALESAGLVFGEPVPGDSLFVTVILPEGWTKSGTGHSLHCDLLDDKGRKRASIFYKAAFYDRSAYLNAVRRYEIDMDWVLAEKEGVIVMFAIDGGNTRVFETQKPYAGKQYDDDYREQKSAAYNQVEAWLNENHPDWKDASAYWD